MSLARASATRAISPCMNPLSSARGHAALGLDLLEQRPGFAGQLVGQLLDVPGAARRDR